MTRIFLAVLALTILTAGSARASLPISVIETVKKVEREAEGARRGGFLIRRAVRAVARVAVRPVRAVRRVAVRRVSVIGGYGGVALRRAAVFGSAYGVGVDACDVAPDVTPIPTLSLRAASNYGVAVRRLAVGVCH